MTSVLLFCLAVVVLASSSSSSVVRGALAVPSITVSHRRGLSNSAAAAPRSFSSLSLYPAFSIRGGGRGTQLAGGLIRITGRNDISQTGATTTTTTTTTTAISATSTTEPSSTSTSTSSTDAPPIIQYNQTSYDPSTSTISTLLNDLQTNLETGLTPQQVSSRLVQYGYNTLGETPTKTWFQLIKEQFNDRLVQILLIVAAMSGIFSFFERRSSVASGEDVGTLLQSFVEPLIILAILILNAMVGAIQAKSAEGSLEALKSLQPSLATVLRQSTWCDNINAAELVPGDVIRFRVGDKIPADARIVQFQSSSLSVEEGSLTGESTTVQKLPGDEGVCAEMGRPIQDQKGMVFSGTMVTSGSGLGLVVRTGMNTEMGKIQQGVTEAKSDEHKTPLGIKLDEFGDTLTVIIGVICLAVWFVSIPKFDDPSFASVWEGAIYYAKVAIALGVAAIPEGLPAVITLCLSLGTRRMAQRNVIVRKLPSVETLGCTSVICTDKTGTLTTNEMTAVSLVLLEGDRMGGRNNDNHQRQHHLGRGSTAPGGEGGSGVVVEHLIDGFSYSPIGKVDGIVPNEEIRKIPHGSVADVAAVSALCNDAKVVGHDGTTLDDENDDDGTSAEDVVNEDGTIHQRRTAGSTKKKKRKKRGEATERTYERVGEPTEAALCVLAEKLGGMAHYLDKPISDERGIHLNVPPSVLASANVNTWRKEHPRTATLEFSRDRKSMSVLCQFPLSHQGGSERRNAGTVGNRLLVKGAPNLLLNRCTHVKFRDGTVSKLTGELRRSIETKTSELATRPLRCLALAVKEYDNLERSLKSFAPSTPNGGEGGGEINTNMEGGTTSPGSKHPLLSDPSNYADIESGLTLVGIVGIKDPARPEVSDSINKCSEAGIRVMMITGDARDTAVAIARDVNIFPPKGEGLEDDIKAFEGREFFVKPESEQLDLLKSGNMVFCRAEPADKQKLVRMLQSLNEIPAMTGDGVNDAPALQQAAIGIAMGITGTEVAKEAADMVLADDNFSTIVSAVEEGRCIYANMQAFICFLISCNIGEICAILLATIAGFPEPLTAMHLLWVNLVTDGPPATALGFNPPAPDLMTQRPRPSDEPIMTRWLLTRYCLTGLYVGLAAVGVFVGHYMSQGVTLSELSSWSKCGELWAPAGGGMTCEDLFQESGRMLPQTLSLTTLVCMEMLKALSAVSVDNSIFTVGPQKNPWLVLGVSVPFLLHVAVVYSETLGVPGLGESFGVVPLSLENWITVLKWSAPILLVDEILKAIGRRVNKAADANRNAEVQGTSQA